MVVLWHELLEPRIVVALSYLEASSHNAWESTGCSYSKRWVLLFLLLSLLLLLLLYYFDLFCSGIHCEGLSCWFAVAAADEVAAAVAFPSSAAPVADVITGPNNMLQLP